MTSPLNTSHSHPVTATARPGYDQSGHRDAVITSRAEAGEDLVAIGLDYGMSRERVRQIVSRNSTRTNAEIRAARAALRKQKRAAALDAFAEHIRQVAANHPDVPIATVADLSGATTAQVRAALAWVDTERRPAKAEPTAQTPDEEILAEVRRVAGLDGGTPLTHRFYEDNYEAGVSPSRLIQRFGTWSAACEAAGVSSVATKRNYHRKWTREDMIGWVWEYLTEADVVPSYARFEDWLRTQHGAPSAQTVRNTLGTWQDMKRLAIETHHHS